MPHIPGLMMYREVFRRLVQPSASWTIWARVLGIHRVLCRRREDQEAQAALGRAARAPWMDPGGNGGCFPPAVWDTLMACVSSDLFSGLLLWEASASLKASVPMKSSLERFKWFGGFRVFGESILAINPPASSAESGPVRGEKAGGDFYPPGAPKCPPSLQPSPRLSEQLLLCWAAVARASARSHCCSLIRHWVCN